MFDSVITLSLTVAAISAGLMAGVYFAFSAFIMRSFDQLGATRATDAMNAINDVILHSWFMVLFFGSTLLYAMLSANALFDADLTGRWLLFAIGVIYIVGMFACTVMFNVPLNNYLAKASSNDCTTSETWALYFRQWTRWNHLRSVGSLVTFVLSMYYLTNYT